MDPVTKAVLSSWHWRPEVLLVLGGLGILYTIGWWRLRQRTRRSRWGQAASWRLIFYWFGLVIIGLALFSPIELLVQQLFVMHMFQHLLMIMIAPPLLLIANPMPLILWGLPDGVRRGVGAGIGRLLNRHAAFRHGLRSATGSGVVWLIWVVSLLGWHDPALYNAALESSVIHDIEHLTFFIASLLFWWRITGAGPHIHKQTSLIGRVATLMAAVPLNMFLGIALFFANKPWYTYYLAVPRLWGLDALYDQQLGGFIMWVPGSMMYIVAAVFLLGQYVAAEDRKPPLPTSRWNDEKTLSAPGFKHGS